MTTASQLATRCDDRFRGSANSVITASQWLSYLNEAYNRVNVFSPWWPWLETSEQTISFSANVRSANLPTDVLKAYLATVVEGRLTVPIHRTYTLDEIAQAHADMEHGRATGKLVVIP